MRLKVEEEVGEAISGHNEAEAKRVAALKAIADLGSENEQLLHHLITRHEEVQKEISSLHKKCSLFVSSHNFAVKRENIEELYLFLKEKVQSGVQISPEMAEEMHELVYHTTMSQSSPELAMEVLALLLELNVSEDEEMLLRQRIQEMVGASPPKRAEAPKLFEESETGMLCYI